MVEMICQDCLRVHPAPPDGQLDIAGYAYCPTCEGTLCDCEGCTRLLARLRQGKRGWVTGLITAIRAWSEKTGAVG